MNTVVVHRTGPRPWLTLALVLALSLLVMAWLGIGWFDAPQHGLSFTFDDEHLEIGSFDGVGFWGGLFGLVIGLFAAAVALFIVVPLALGLVLLGVALAIAAVLFPLALLLAVALSPLLLPLLLLWLLLRRRA